MGQTRGRRREKSKKKEEDISADFLSAQKNASTTDFSGDFIALDDDQVDPEEKSAQAAFYGLLDRQELEYFKNAEATLAANALAPDEREAFVNSIYEEAKGKELKLATNQVLSKLLERLIAMSNDEQLVNLLQAFNGHVFRLSLQKYSSHCVESLLFRAAGLVDREILGTLQLEQNGSDVVVTAESLVIYLVNDLRPHIKEMTGEKYSSHVLRQVLLLLSGLPLSSNSALRSKKSKLARKYTELEESIAFNDRQVPAAFKDAAKEIIKELTEGMTAVEARRMAIDPLGSPLLQIILRIQISRDSFGLVEQILKGDGAEAFWEHLLSDTIGSHFLQYVVGILPRKILNSFYDVNFKGRAAKIAKRESGRYVIEGLLKSNLGPKLEMVKELVGEAKEILDEGSYGVLVAAYGVAEAPEKKEITMKILEHYGGIEKLLETARKDTAKAVLLQTLAEDTTLLNEAGKILSSWPHNEIKVMATDPVQSHVLQALLRPEMDIIERRKLLNSFVAIILELTINSYGSHIVDALWQYCYKIKFARERIASELSKHEEEVKNSMYGKIVWRNWQLDKYLRKRHEWWDFVKKNEDSLSESLPQEFVKRTLLKPGTPSKSPTNRLDRNNRGQARKPYDRP